MRGNTERQIPGDNSPHLSDTPSENKRKCFKLCVRVCGVQVSRLTRILPMHRHRSHRRYADNTEYNTNISVICIQTHTVPQSANCGYKLPNTYSKAETTDHFHTVID